MQTFVLGGAAGGVVPAKAVSVAGGSDSGKTS